VSSITILPTKKADLVEISVRLRPADRAEFIASTGRDPEEYFVPHLAKSAQYTAFIGDKPVAVFGCTDAGPYGAPWLMGTKELEGFEVARAMVRFGRTFFDAWAERYMCLRNLTYAHNHLHHKFIRALGADLKDEIIHVGPRRSPFKEFTYSV